MAIRATQVSRVNLSADRTIAQGGSIAVSMIVVANSNAQPVEIDFSDGTSTKRFTVTVPGFDSIDLHLEFIADQGLYIDQLVAGGDKVFVSVFHSAVGA